jgi:hypothetical protein
VIILIITPLKYVLYHEYPTEKKKKTNPILNFCWVWSIDPEVSERKTKTYQMEEQLK